MQKSEQRILTTHVGSLPRSPALADLLIRQERGVIDSAVNYIEHPEVVAQRIMQAVEAVGDKSRVIASTDCGFGTFAGYDMVAEGVVWAKIQALKQGARIASARLWG